MRLARQLIGPTLLCGAGAALAYPFPAAYQAVEMAAALKAAQADQRPLLLMVSMHG